MVEEDKLYIRRHRANLLHQKGKISRGLWVGEEDQKDEGKAQRNGEEDWRGIKEYAVWESAMVRRKQNPADSGKD